MYGAPTFFFKYPGFEWVSPWSVTGMYVHYGVLAALALAIAAGAWFRVVAPHRAELVTGTSRSRLAVLDRYWPALVGDAWEQLCRQRIPHARHPALGEPGTWTPPQRWWHGAAPEWDIVAEDAGRRRLLLGEAKVSAGHLRRLVAEVAARPAPELPAAFKRHTVVRAVCVPDTQRVREMDDIAIVTLKDLATL
jgi:hypothetical protein